MQLVAKPEIQIENRKMDKDKQLHYIHNIRGLSILLIVAIHAMEIQVWKENHVAERFIRIFIENGTNIFLFIAGFLFYYLRAKFEYVNYLKKKINYVVSPYLFLSIFVISNHIISHKVPYMATIDFTQYSIPEQFFLYLVTGQHLTPFWYIPMICIFFMLSPITNKFMRTRTFDIVVVPLLLLSFFTFRPENNGDPLLAFIHFFPTYYFGIWSCKHIVKITHINKAYVWIGGAVWFLLSIGYLLGYLDDVRFNNFQDIVKNNLIIYNHPYLRVSLFTLLLIYFFYKYFNQKNVFFGLLADYSFGIYFLHFLFLIVLRAVLNKVGMAAYTNDLFVFILLFFGSLMISIVLIYFIKKILKQRSRLIVGS